jgi:dipeptidyl aminopeptidase/acylaminoacyl peptidase
MYPILLEINDCVGLTTGEWEVESISGIDLERKLVFYTSTQEDSTQRHLYSVSIMPSPQVTKLTPPPGFNLTASLKSFIKNEAPVGQVAWFSASMSPKGLFLSLQYEGPDLPWSSVYETKAMRRIRPEARASSSAFQKYAFPMKGIFTIPNGHGDELNAQMIVPADFDPSRASKYPVFMEVYGGPDSQKVTQKFSSGWANELASYGIIHLMVDGRGTGWKGR